MTDARNAIHAALTAVMAWLSFVLNLPGDTFASPAFAQFARLATEQQWAYIFMATACGGLVGLVSDRAWVRLASVFLLATVHGLVAYCFYLAPPSGTWIGTGTGTYAIIAGLGYYLAYRRFLT